MRRKKPDYQRIRRLERELGLAPPAPRKEEWLVDTLVARNLIRSGEAYHLPSRAREQEHAE